MFVDSIICIRWADGLSSFFHSCCGWRGKRTGAVWFYNQASRPIKVYEGEDDGWRESVKTFYSPTIWFYLSGLFCVVLIIRLRMDTSQIYRCVIIRAVWYKDTSGICILKDAIFSLITFHNLHTKRFIFPITREASVKKKVHLCFSLPASSRNGETFVRSRKSLIFNGDFKGRQSDSPREHRRQKRKRLIDIDNGIPPLAEHLGQRSHAFPRSYRESQVFDVYGESVFSFFCLIGRC